MVGMSARDFAIPIAVGFVLFFVNSAALTAIFNLFPWAEKALTGEGSWWMRMPVIFQAFYVFAVAPVLEEILHRQIILNLTMKKLGTIPAILISSATFGIHHCLTGWGWLKAVDMFFVGLVFGLIYIRYGLKGSWMCHTANNSIAALGILLRL